jgi:hypothetical protein
MGISFHTIQDTTTPIQDTVDVLQDTNIYLQDTTDTIQDIGIYLQDTTQDITQILVTLDVLLLLVPCLYLITLCCYHDNLLWLLILFVFLVFFLGL